MSNATEKTTVAATPENPAAESDTLIKFSKPYVFENQTYTEIDLAGLENLTARDMIDAEKYLFKAASSPRCRTRPRSISASSPVEWPVSRGVFQGLPRKTSHG